MNTCAPRCNGGGDDFWKILEGAAWFRRYEPDTRLAERMNGFWSLTAPKPPVRLRLIPDGRIDVIFDLDLRTALVASGSQQPSEVVHDRPTRLFGVTPPPVAAGAFLGAEARSLRQECVDFRRELTQDFH